MKKLFIFLAIVALAFVGCASAPAQTVPSQQAYNNSTGVIVAQAPQVTQVVASSCGSYNNLRPSGNQLVAGVDAMKVMPHLKSNGAQLWFNTDNGLWENQGGKFSIFFTSQAAMDAYCRNPFPSPAELRRMTAAEPRCKASVGDQKWLPF